MIAGNKIMDVPRHILKTLFSDTKFPIIQHHLDSFNDMLDVGIPEFIKASNPLELEVKGNRFVRVYIGGKDGSKIRYTSPTDDDGSAVVPHTCRLDDRTYAFSVFADIDIEYEFSDKSVVTKSFSDVRLGDIPLMLRSRLCYLSGMDGYEIGECKYELGGYFIIDGAEKVLLTQELLGNNMFYAGQRTRKAPKGAKKSLVERDMPLVMNKTYDEEDEDVSYEENIEYYASIRTLSEDGTRGPYSHFLMLPSSTTSSNVDLETMKGNIGVDNRLPMIQIPGFEQAVPVLSVFRALGITSDRDLYDTVLAGVPDKDRLVYDHTFREIILTHEKFLAQQQQTDLEILAAQTRNKSRFGVVVALREQLFSHVEGEENLRRKAYMLGHLLKMAMDVAIERRKPSDRDNMQFKRLKTSGVLMFEEFRRIYRSVARDMISRIDRKNTFEASQFADKALAEIVQPENMNYYWRSFTMLNEYLKSFKGAWGGRVGIAQQLMRPSYIAVIHHLRKTDLQIDKSSSTAPPRRLHASQFGLMCPLDSPDGSDIGYKKALSILARVTTAFPAEKVKEVMRSSGLVRDISLVHPATWRPEWTRIYLNSDLVGLCVGDTEVFHAYMRTARRTGQLALGVSLAWNRLNNTYTIYSDAGRPVRPVYREGTTPEQIQEAKTWEQILQHVDYIDASESDAIRISMTPFDPVSPSEIHMSFNMSAVANLVPYADHNPATRNMFSIAQQKSASSIFHTNYMKRFDTNAMLNVSSQKPLSQTWMYNEIMGAGGCLSYGENAIVAFTMYGGHNQEDSVIVNQDAIKRGMGRMMYYHSYNMTEEMLDETANLHTEIANPLKDETIKRKEGFNYEHLDADGIIKVGTLVDENTILVGILSPITSGTGQTIGYRDISVEPKRGQVGRVDAVYRFSVQAGVGFKDGKRVPMYVRGVKVRILEERIPAIGDKMASRHSQKGTIGMVMPEEDMPFTASGVRPDIIFNPHGIPTRMTVGQFLEAASNKLGIDIGSFVDATPFTISNRLDDLKMALLQRGFHHYGHEILYNGQTGEVMESDIFMGPIYYQRLKQMVEDKINYRTTGPRTLLTHQPVQGRDNDGGLRIGEMERDSLIAHGMSKFLNESLMERSDKESRQFDKEQGRFDTSRDVLDVPYAAALYTQELESLHIETKLITYD
jgi:DNA-directed RNA polymerase II subunit RPB2